MAVARRHRRVFENVLAHRNRVYVAQLSYWGGVSPEFFEKTVIYWFLEGSGHLEKFRTPTDKLFWPPKIKKIIETLIFRCGYIKYVFVEKAGIFFPFLALGAPCRGRAHWRGLAVFRPKKFRTRNTLKNMLKTLFWLRFQKMCFRRKQSDFRDFFSFSALGASF